MLFENDPSGKYRIANGKPISRKRALSVLVKAAPYSVSLNWATVTEGRRKDTGWDSSCMRHGVLCERCNQTTLCFRLHSQ